jgi:hypothetical protein
VRAWRSFSSKKPRTMTRRSRGFAFTHALSFSFSVATTLQKKRCVAQQPFTGCSRRKAVDSRFRNSRAISERHVGIGRNTGASIGSMDEPNQAHAAEMATVLPLHSSARMRLSPLRAGKSW